MVLEQQRILSEEVISTEDMENNKWAKGRKGQLGTFFKYSFLVYESKRQKEAPSSLSMGTKQNGTSYAQDDILFYMDPRLLYKNPCFTWVLKPFSFSFFFFKFMFKEASWIFLPLLETAHCVLSISILALYKINKAQMTKKCIVISTFK